MISKQVLAGTDAVISAVGVYGNPVQKMQKAKRFSLAGKNWSTMRITLAATSLPALAVP